MRKKKKRRTLKYKFRFPRLYLTPKALLTEKILRHTYNRMASERNGHPSYDIYKTKPGILYNSRFLILAQDLVDKQIDPQVYIKVMSQYGKFSNSKHLPAPTFLASEKTIANYDWLKKKERGKYPSEKEWHHSLKEDLKSGVKEVMKSSALMVRDVRKNFNLKMYEALVFLRGEISPWYWATFLSLIKRRKRRDEILDFLWLEDRVLRHEVIKCTKGFLNNRDLWQMSCGILRKYL